MNSLTQVLRPHAALERGLDSLRPWLLLALRLWVSWQFLKSGWLKLTHWDVTLELFHSEYQVPLLPPTVAAVVGTTGRAAVPNTAGARLAHSRRRAGTLCRQCTRGDFVLAVSRRRRKRSGARAARAVGIHDRRTGSVRRRRAHARREVRPPVAPARTPRRPPRRAGPVVVRRAPAPRGVRR